MQQPIPTSSSQAGPVGQRGKPGTAHPRPPLPPVPRPILFPEPQTRIEAIDLARGFAITLMILSHGVKGLLTFEQIPEWGLVPIHLVTKFSSSLFILVFGIALALIYLPWAGTPSWPGRRRKLLLRGLEVFLWYKALTVVEMMHLYAPADIWKTLSYQAFPVYSEILGFYAIALLWVPFFLPLWKRMGSWLKIVCIPAVATLALVLYERFHFWGIEQLQALLVEHEKHYTWGQLSRAPLVLGGLLIGESLRRHYTRPIQFRKTLAWLMAGGLTLLGLFVLHSRAGEGLSPSLMAVAMNEGKHPPEPGFMLFSVGGALLILSGSLWGGERLARLLRPLTLIGKNALQSFVCHLFVLFVFYRILFDLWHQISYVHALILTGILVVLTSSWIGVLRWVQGRS